MGVRHLEAFASKDWHGLGPLNELYLSLKVEETRERATGLVVHRDARPGLWVAGASNFELWLDLHPQSRVRTSAAAPL